MKSFLDLAGISARVRRRQSRMTRLCIILSVFLVTAIFGMADMWLNCQKIQAIQQYGNWHTQFIGLSEEDGTLVSARPEVEASSWYDVVNSHLDEDYTVNGTRVAVCGADESWKEIFPSTEILEGGYSAEPGTICMTQNAKILLGVQPGDTVTLALPDGRAEDYLLTGLFGDTVMMAEQDGAGVIMNSGDYRRFVGQPMAMYVQYKPFIRIHRAAEEIRVQFGLAEDAVGNNPKLLGISGQSDNAFMQMLYTAAAILSGLVAVSGILMMTGSMNSSVAQRTEFFGLLRCLGATPKPVKRFVRREALGWCGASIPAGLLAGTAVCWALCEMLRFLAPTYFAEMPRFGISPVAIASGALLGVLTVLFSARTPAKRASAVSPLTAVSGNAGTVQAAETAADTRFLPVQTALGIHHAVGSKRNFLLMTGSFAFSIILFLSFSVVVSFMHHAVTPVRPSAPDFSIISPEDICSIPASLVEQISAIPSVKRVFGRSFAYGLECSRGETPVRVDLISYEENQFGWAEKSRLDGSVADAEEGRGLLLTYNSDSVLETGDFLQINGYALPITGSVGYSPFDHEPGTETLFCSEELFRQLTGESGYTIIDVQFHRNVTEEDTAQIRALAGDAFRFSDRRLSNRDAKGAYYSFALFVYGFLALIALITVFHIVNSIALSVSARMKQYGAMRAVGMDIRQLTDMVTAEALTYALSGVVMGCGLGLPLHRLLFQQMVAFQWGDRWNMPWLAMLVIVLVLLAAVALSVMAPAKRIRELSITDTISAE